MSGYGFDLGDAHELGHWVEQIASGTVDVVGIRDGEEVVAMLCRPQSEPKPPAGWIAAGHSYGDEELPEPFNAIGFKSNNIGASVWIELTSGAMVAALPTGVWKERAQFAFYFAPANATSAIWLKGWSADQESWDGSDPKDFRIRHRRAISYFNAVIGGGSHSVGDLP